MSPQAAKTCVVCGTDCANTPRVKDPRGRYFCKPCYEKALKTKRSAASGSSRPRHDDIQVEGDERDSRRAPSAGWGGSLLDDDGPAAAGACPECGSALDEGAVLCVNCGYVLRAGKHITPKIEEDEEEVDSASITGEGVRQTKWPIVIGAISIIFAFFGALSYGGVAVGAALTDPVEAGGPLIWAGSLVLFPILLALSIALGVLAVGLFMRRAFAAIWLPRWAWAKMLASILYVGLVGARIAIDTPAELAAFGAIGIVVIAPIMLIWLLFWPVFLLLWMRRKAIKEEVAQWK